MSKKDIKVLHAVDWFLIGVMALCLVTLAMLDTHKSAQAQTCFGDCTVFVEPIITQDPILVLQRLTVHNRPYYAAEMAYKNRWRSYGYDIAIPIYEAGRSLPAAAAVRGTYDLELQRRSLCAGFASNRAAGPEGVYAGRALGCRRSVFD
jgi:hypothetical protein